MSVVLSIQHAMRMRHIVIYGLSGCTTPFRIISSGAIFRKESYVTKFVF
jgi:hypothetical protein